MTRPISPDLCPPNSPVDYRIWGLMRECVYIVQTLVRDTSVSSDLNQRLDDTRASVSQNVINGAVLVNGECGCVQA